MELSVGDIDAPEAALADDGHAAGPGGHAIERGVGGRVQGEDLEAHVERAAAGLDQVPAGDVLAHLEEQRGRVVMTQRRHIAERGKLRHSIGRQGSCPTSFHKQHSIGPTLPGHEMKCLRYV